MSRLRASITVIEQELALIPPTETLHAAWRELVAVLALGPAPQTRTCPTCNGVGMRAASRCSRCWAALAPLPPNAPRLDDITHMESP